MSLGLIILNIYIICSIYILRVMLIEHIYTKTCKSRLCVRNERGKNNEKINNNDIKYVNYL